MHEEGDHATKNQLSGSLLQGDGLEKRLEQWECILHDQHGRLLLQRLANGPLPHHYFAQIRRKEEAPPLSPHTSKKRNFKTVIGGFSIADRLAIRGDTTVIIGNRGGSETFPYGYFRAWTLNTNTGRFDRV